MNDSLKKERCLNTLREILSFCETIERRKRDYNITLRSIKANSDHADLVLMPLCQIGESVQSLRHELEKLYPSIPWHKMAGLRNVIVHGYTKIDPATVIATVNNDIPRLRDFCRRELKKHTASF